MPTSGNPSIAGLATGTERWKKVDLVISGDLTLSMGGEINVGGKGYPGGYYTNICGNNCVSTDPPHGFLSNNPSWFDGNGSQQTFGWGPGGGVTSPTSDWQGGGGGGFAGAGRQGFQWTGSIYYFKTGPGSMKTGVQSDGFNYGSGDYTYQPTAGSYEWGSVGGAAGTHGGSGSQNDVTVLFGGAGGGKVIIDARNIVFADYYQNSVLQDKNMNYTPGDTYTGIYADGQSGMIAQNENNAVWGGGGSGGLIYISGNINYNGSTLQASVSPGYMTDLGHAQFGKIQDSTGTDMSAKAFNLFARGGDARNANYNQTHGSGGGGGWIVFGNNNNRMTVNKTLYPVHRDGLPKDCVLNSSDGTPKTTDSSYPGCLFNPYAVQNNDVIEVRLEMQGNTVGVPYTIRDEWLQFPNPNDGYCTPLTNGQISAPGSTLYSATPGHDHPDGALDTSPYDFTIKDNINVLFYQCRVGTN
jgi:hypothetical protein